MRRGMSLIELIFTMLIISVIFMVVPRLISVTNRSMQLELKEEALFDAISLSFLLSTLPWDQNTTNTNGAILKAGGVECNASTGYRTGGFIGSRNCIGYANTPPDDKVNDCDDLDDYNDKSCYEDNTTGGHLPYNLKVTIRRNKDKKHLIVEVNTSNSGRFGKFDSKFFFDSYNLGWVHINRRVWR